MSAIIPLRHYSPSSIDQSIPDEDKGCERAWGYRYIAKLKQPDLLWTQQLEAAEYDKDSRLWVYPDKRTKVPTGARSRALGTAVHAVLEAWYLGGSPNWATFPGQVALAGTHYLPHPSRCLDIRVEDQIGTDPYPFPSKYFQYAKEAAPGIFFVGKVDLAAKLFPEEAARLGIDVSRSDGWATFDYKTSKDLNWCKDVRTLEGDGQVNLYLGDMLEDIDRRLGIPRMTTPGEFARWSNLRVPGRWLYFYSGKKRAAKPVDVYRTYEQTQARVHLMVEQAQYLETLTDVEQCAPNPNVCEHMFGQVCEYHHSVGGPCKAQRRLGKAIQRPRTHQQEQQRKQDIMGFLNGKFATRPGATTAPAAAAPAAPAAAAPPPPPPPPAAEPPPAAPPAAAGRPGRPGRPARTAAPAAAPEASPGVTNVVVNEAPPTESTGPKISITISNLDPGDARDLAGILAELMGAPAAAE